MAVYAMARWSGTSPISKRSPPHLSCAVDVEEKAAKFHAPSCARRPPRVRRRALYLGWNFKYLVGERRQTIPILPPGARLIYDRGQRGLGKVTFFRPQTVVFEWQIPQSEFPGRCWHRPAPPFHLPPPTICHSSTWKFSPTLTRLSRKVKSARVISWARAATNKRDNMYSSTIPRSQRCSRDQHVGHGRSRPNFFRAKPLIPPASTSRGVQLPYIDVVQMTVVAVG